MPNIENITNGGIPSGEAYIITATPSLKPLIKYHLREFFNINKINSSDEDKFINAVDKFIKEKYPLPFQKKISFDISYSDFIKNASEICSDLPDLLKWAIEDTLKAYIDRCMIPELDKEQSKNFAIYGANYDNPKATLIAEDTDLRKLSLGSVSKKMYTDAFVIINADCKTNDGVSNVRYVLRFKPMLNS